MKKAPLFIVAILMVFCFSDVSAQQIPYQAVARSASGNLIQNQTVSLRFTIHSGSAGGTNVYQETGSSTTNEFGLFTYNIGTNASLSGVNWAASTMFMQVEMDPTGGTSYTNMGTQQMLYVPYALYSLSSGSGAGATGPTGAAGANGTNGATGHTGANGTNGVTGPTGAAGANGTNGINGTNGATGPTGAAGTNGTNGLNGTNGTNGATGANGSNGTNGSTGPTGATGAGILQNGAAAGNTPYWNGSSWITNSSNVFNNGGNVGIGTTGPIRTLDVAGTTRTTGFMMPTGAGSGYLLTSDSAGNGTWSQNSLSALESSLTGNFSCLAFAGSATTGGDPFVVTVSGNYAYEVSSGNSTLGIYNISSATPVQVASIATGSIPYSVAVSGSYAYVVDAGSNDLRIYNVSTPASPTQVGSVATGSSPYSVVVSGNYAYVVDHVSNDLRIFDVSNSASPVQVGSVATGTSPKDLAISGGYVYVVDGVSADLRIYNVSTPSAPVQVGSIATGTNPYSVAVSGSYAYVIDATNYDLRVYNVGTPSSPVQVGSVATGAFPCTVTVSGNYAYVVDVNSDDLRVYNISNPSSPVQVGSVATGAGPTGVVVSGNYAYVVNENSSTLWAFTIGCVEPVGINTSTGALTTISPVSGPTGATGPTGAAGTNGATGAAGTNGTTGATGPTGAANTSSSYMFLGGGYELQSTTVSTWYSALTGTQVSYGISPLFTQPIPNACTLDAIYIYAVSLAGSSGANTVTGTILQNGSPTGFTCSFTMPANAVNNQVFTAHNTGSALAVNAGDVLIMQWVESNASTGPLPIINFSIHAH